MNVDHFSQQAEDFHRVETALQFIEANFKDQPSLDQIARRVHLSKYHFDRLFKRWAGISPVRFMHFITLDYTKQQLAKSKSLLDTALDAGLSGPGRLHDLFVNFDAMTPGEFKKQGEGLTVSYGFCKSPFGTCLLATTRRGICFLGFVGEGGDKKALDQLFQTWPGSDFKESPKRIAPIIKNIFTMDKKNPRPFNLRVKGTNFQVNVWKALLTIPRGCLISYQDIAAHIGNPKSCRAVAGAIAANPVSFLIPCHRVITTSGAIHRYRWGASRKKALIGWEAALSLT